jgi:hypothetical protein
MSSILIFFTVPYCFLLGIFKYFFIDRHELSLLIVDLGLLKMDTEKYKFEPEFLSYPIVEEVFETLNWLVVIAPVVMSIGFMVYKYKETKIWGKSDEKIMIKKLPEEENLNTRSKFTLIDHTSNNQ